MGLDVIVVVGACGGTCGLTCGCTSGRTGGAVGLDVSFVVGAGGLSCWLSGWLSCWHLSSLLGARVARFLLTRRGCLLQSSLARFNFATLHAMLRSWEG
jgi:hypothetical protein